MENEQGIGYLIVVSSSILIFIAITFILFAINQRRKRHALETIIDIVKNKNNENIQQIKNGNEDNTKEIQNLKFEMDELKKEVIKLREK